MLLLIRCPGCQKPLKVKEELTGKKVKCPSCGQPVPVTPSEPTSQPAEEAESVRMEIEDKPAAKPAKPAPAASRVTVEPEPATLEADEPEADSVTDEKPRRKDDRGAGRKDDRDRPAGKSKWVPCPKCGTEDPKRIKFTFWGSFYFTNMLNHARCTQCGYKYNAKTGRSNLPWAIVCVMIPALLILAIIGGLVGFVWYIMAQDQKQNTPSRRSDAIIREWTPPGANSRG